MQGGFQLVMRRKNISFLKNIENYHEINYNKRITKNIEKK